jgi:hypothetical protein
LSGLAANCCTPPAPHDGKARQIPRDFHECARDVTRRLMRTKAFLKSRDQRKRVEMCFAHLKIHHSFERMRLRGLSGARDEFLLAATVQNLKTFGAPITRATTRPATSIVCLRSLMLASVACASRSPPIKRPEPNSRLISAGSKLTGIPPTGKPTF